MKPFWMVVLAAGIGVGGWWLWNYHSPFRDTIAEYIENGEFLTLEAHYAPEIIMETHRKELLASSQYSYQDPCVKYVPYLLIEAKYTHSDKKTREGILLWGLADGEIVLDTDTWELTHGYADAIEADATRADYRILNALSKHNGSMSRDDLAQELHVEDDTLEPLLESAIEKQLIVQSGSEVQLHFQNPKLLTTPQTKVRQTLVTKPYSHSQKLSRKYSKNQIETAAKAAFGPTFAIRKISEVYLPIYCIGVQNPDGSLLTSYWNAITGKQIVTSTLLR